MSREQPHYTKFIADQNQITAAADNYRAKCAILDDVVENAKAAIVRAYDEINIAREVAKDIGLAVEFMYIPMIEREIRRHLDNLKVPGGMILTVRL